MIFKYLVIFLSIQFNKNFDKVISLVIVKKKNNIQLTMQVLYMNKYMIVVNRK